MESVCSWDILSWRQRTSTRPARRSRSSKASAGGSITDTLRARPVNRGTGPRLNDENGEGDLKGSSCVFSKLEQKVERKRLITDLLNFEQQAGQMEAQEDPPRLRQQTQPIPITRLQKALGERQGNSGIRSHRTGSYCLAITRDHTEVLQLASRTQIGKQVEPVLTALRKEGPGAGAAAALYAKVIAPMESVVSAKTRLIVIPDGPLYCCHSRLSDHGRTGFLESHVITYAPSGTVFTLLAEKTGPRRPIPLLAVATGSDALAGVAAASADHQPFGKINREVFDASRLSSPLPAANGEARTVAGILGGKSVMLLGDSATKSALKKEPLGQFRVLHFAAHGLVSTKFPERSALLLYPDPPVPRMASGKRGRSRERN